MQKTSFFKITVRKRHSYGSRLHEKGDIRYGNKRAREIYWKKILVVLTDGRKIIGEFDSVAPDYDTESGKDELELFVGGIYITVPIDEVKNIKMV